MELKNTFKNVGILYKNFLHWNISKVSIWIFSLLIALVMTLPVVAISLILCWIMWVDWLGYLLTFSAGTLNAAVIYTVDFFIFCFFAIISALTFFLSLSYGKIMYFDLNLQYLENKKAEYLKTKFFSPKLFLKFYNISLWVGLYLLIPVWVFIIWMIAAIAVNGWVNETGVALDNWNQVLAVGTFIVAIVSISIFVYLSYRLYFSYVWLVDFKKFEELQPAKNYVKHSFKITRGWKKPLKLIGILFIFALIIAPYTIFSQALENTFNDMSNYSKYVEMGEQEKLLITQQNPQFQSVILKYQDVNIWDLQRNISLYNFMLIFLGVFGFLIITGIIEMVMVSHYKQASTDVKIKKVVSKIDDKGENKKIEL